MGKVITREECNAIIPLTFTTGLTKCPTYQEIMSAHSGFLIAGSYDNDQLVQAQDVSLSVDAYIEFEIDSSSGSFIIPFSQVCENGQNYSFVVIVDGQFRGTATGSVNINNGTGNNAPIAPVSRSTIRIIGRNGSPVGWGRAFGFYSNDVGCNAPSNKAKLLRIINDPEYAHLATLNSTGDLYRVSQYDNCINLSAGVEEQLPNSITIIGNSFRVAQYSNCVGLTTPVTEQMPSTVTSIGGGFRGNQYLNCSGLTRTSPEAFRINITNVGENFRIEQYDGCPNIRISGHTHAYPFASFLNQNEGNYYRMFSVNTGVSTSDNLSRYYTNSAQTTTAFITNTFPTTPKGYLNGRTGVSGYSTINQNWVILGAL